MSSVLVVGAGAWGTALAIQAARAGSTVALWARDPGRAEALAASRENPRLPGARLPDAVRVVSEMEPADILLLAAPMQHVRRSCAELPMGVMVACAKGMETATGLLPLELLAALHPGRPAAVLTGPNFAREIAAGLPAASVAAAADPAIRAAVIAAVATREFRLYGSDDAIGAQIGGAAKNVLAIAAGVVIGAGLGENARAALVTRGLAELVRLAVALGGQERTVTGLSGMGDLLLTCTGLASRNFSFGAALGRGERVGDALAARSSAIEGVATAPALVARARVAGVGLPICEAVASLLGGEINVPEAAERLLTRRPREE